MRITREAKERNREYILEAAEKLFADKGYENTTTRDISNAVGMAKGTLFNYFACKETLAMTMVARAMEAGRKQYLKRRTGDEGLGEELFLFIAAELRALKPFRKYIGPVLESCMSVFAKANACPAGEQARIEHLKTVQGVLRRHGFEIERESFVVTLYWSLYLGILAHWSKDGTRNQAETLALADYSIQAFVNTISSSRAEHEIAGNE